MAENAFVVIFPSIFSKNKIPKIISNIKKILNIRNQKFRLVRRDDDIILLDANDPVFASSAVNLLFGIRKIAIARQVKNDFDIIVSEITKIGGNLLLKGDKFLVQVEGHSSGFLTKDVEITATSSIIEKKAKLGARPGTIENNDKILYTYLTKKHAYTCIFTEEGKGGVPNNSQDSQLICCIYDELSAVSCLESMKEGFDVKIIVCYRRKSELAKLAKILNVLLPITLKLKIELEFFKLDIKQTGANNYFLYLKAIAELSSLVAKKNSIKWVSLALSPLMVPVSFIGKITQLIFKDGLIPCFPLQGFDDDVFNTAKELGLGKYLTKIERLGIMKIPKLPLKQTNELVKNALNAKRTVAITLGPNNVHDILDSFE